MATEVEPLPPLAGPASDVLLRALQSIDLFDGIDPEDLEALARRCRMLDFGPRQEVLAEGSVATSMYMLESGEVAVLKRSAAGTAHEIGRMTGRTLFGELALLGMKERTAAVRAITPIRVVEMPAEAVMQMSPKSCAVILARLGQGVAGRLRAATDVTVASLEKAVAESETRVRMGYFMVAVMAVFTAFTTLLSTAAEVERRLGRAEFVTIPLLVAVTGVVIVFVRKTGYPARFFGLRVGDWRRQVRDALVWSAPVLLLTVAVKIYLLRTGRVPASEGIFLAFSTPGGPNLLLILAYALFVPSQEFICRGAVQGPLEEFLVGRRRVLVSILISNGVFFVTHLKTSLILAIVSGICGLGWGWLYHRHKSLIGVSLSHALIGIWGFVIVGLPDIG